MSKQMKQVIKAGFIVGVMHFVLGSANGIEDPNAGQVFDSAGVQTRIGNITKIRVEAGETRFQIDSCPENPVVPGFFVIASSNVDKLDITRLLITAMTFKKEVKIYNTNFGDDINYCPGTGLSAGNITVGTVRVQ
ncbi:MAG: hypothetical protein GXP08_04650 [Gammaproteobacteria bacterium]|nr:hypothetical protein [Gammaproteobacteria bacterium]